MAAWAGLGYYARARNLLACARAVAGEHGGRFPETRRRCASCPGIGRYTAAAIAAIAFGRRAVVVDANVERVVARLFAVETAAAGGARARSARLAGSPSTPDENAGDFAQAMMDLGATICTPRNRPIAARCPLAGLLRRPGATARRSFIRSRRAKAAQAAARGHRLLARA